MSDCSCNGSGCKCSVNLSPAEEKGMVIKSYDSFNINFETNYSDVDSLIEINEIKPDVNFKN